MEKIDIGYRIGRLLENSLDSVDSVVSSRLKASREVSISRQRLSRPSLVLAFAESFFFGNGTISVVPKLLLPTAGLVLGLIAINSWQQSQQAEEIEEIDTAVLTGDLPIDAYLDKGFDAWLKRSSL